MWVPVPAYIINECVCVGRRGSCSFDFACQQRQRNTGGNRTLLHATLLALITGSCRAKPNLVGKDHRVQGVLSLWFPLCVSVCLITYTRRIQTVHVRVVVNLFCEVSFHDKHLFSQGQKLWGRISRMRTLLYSRCLPWVNGPNWKSDGLFYDDERFGRGAHITGWRL